MPGYCGITLVRYGWSDGQNPRTERLQLMRKAHERAPPTLGCYAAFIVLFAGTRVPLLNGSPLQCRRSRSTLCQSLRPRSSSTPGLKTRPVVGSVQWAVMLFVRKPELDISNAICQICHVSCDVGSIEGVSVLSSPARPLLTSLPGAGQCRDRMLWSPKNLILMLMVLDLALPSQPFVTLLWHSVSARSRQSQPQ
jgi:hypothetical protein